MADATPAPGAAILVFKDGRWEGSNGTHGVVLTEQAMQRETARYLRQLGTELVAVVGRVPDALTAVPGRVPDALRTVAYWVEHYDPTEGDVHVYPKKRGYTE